MKKPFVSIVMPFFNSEHFIKEAIDSILNQTYDFFEFIIINDGATDNSYEIVKNIKDPRIKLFNGSDNKGNYYRRNEGCKLARGKYVFVMDSDDWAMPERLSTQIDALENIPGLLACGCIHENFQGEICYRTTNSQFIKVNLLYNNAFLHPSLAIRKDILQQINYYNEQYIYSSDYDLVCKLALYGKLINLPDVLMKYRRHSSQISSLYLNQQRVYADQIRLNYLQSCGFILDQEQQNIFTKFMNNDNDIEIKIIKELLNELHKQNNKLNCFNEKLLDLMFQKLLVRV